MLKRTIYISQPMYISTENEQLLLTSKETGEINSLPIQDLGVIEIDNPQIILTANSLRKLLQSNVAVQFTGANHHPIGMALALEDNTLQTQRVLNQISTSEPQKKQIWQQIIKAKIKNQYILLKKNGDNIASLKKLYEDVLSGDKGNKEARAARIYWQYLFRDSKFKRHPEGDYPNNLLNYAYAVLRAVVARAIVSAGLIPAVGVFHKNQYNHFCLADDIMEPYRPYADEIVLAIYRENYLPETLEKDHKARILELPYLDVEIGNKTHPLMVAVQTTVNSLTKIYNSEQKNLLCPVLTE